jgi:predicted nucleic acid-binding protein
MLPAIVLAEVLVGAARRGEEELRLRREQLTAAFGVPVPVDEVVAVAAASLRARHRFLRMPDALVLATADVTAAEVVLTGDKKWSAVDQRVELIGPTPAADEQASADER